MNITESIRIAMRGLGANKLRSALTMLGIIIGVAAVITLLSVGQGVERLVTSSLQSIGSNLLFIVPGRLENAQAGQRSLGPGELTNRDIEALSDPFLVPDVIAVAPEVQGSVEVEYGKSLLRTTLSGVLPNYSQVRNSPVQFGSFVTADHVTSRTRVVVIGSRVVTQLFPDHIYPVGETIRINSIPFRVVGIMEEKGGTGFGSEDNQVFVPLSTAQQRIFPRRRNQAGEPLVSTAYAQVISEDRMDAAGEQIAEVLRSRHNIRFADDDDFTVINQADLISIFGQITGVLTLFLGAIAGISLLVGGIGIMNIMLVSVTERTREIGIRKAVGARRSDILAQFLVEAIILSLLGGAIGIGLGIGGSSLVGNLSADLITVVTLQSILLATGFSALVGLFFGIYPATRAARLNPIDALRYE